MPVKGVLRIVLDEPGKRLGRKFFPGHTEHFRHGKIGLKDGSLGIDGEVAYRGEIVKVAEAVA